MARVKATAPTRIDLAGGTIDLYPLSAFLGGTVTVNVAIDIECRAEFDARDDGGFRILSHDAGAGLEFPSLEALDRHVGPSAVDLPIEALRFWRPSHGLSVTTTSGAPRGSGLGGSSALLVAILGGLRTIEGRGGDFDDKLCDWAAAIEAKLIQVPTGLQDYYGALLGGWLAIDFSLYGARPARLKPPPAFVQWFEENVLLFFTGEPHFSGAPNWAVLKGYVDDAPGTRECLREIARLSPLMRDAVASGDRERFVQVLDAEWSARKRLAEGVTTPDLERIIGAARGAGALAAKACGAGGGGSLIVVAPEGGVEAVAGAAHAAGARRLAYRVSMAGLRVAENAD